MFPVAPPWQHPSVTTFTSSATNHRQHPPANGGHRHWTLQALAQRHGPLFPLRLGSVSTIVVSSASIAEQVLKTQDHVFCSRPQQYTARGILYDCRDVGFCPYGERWGHIVGAHGRVQEDMLDAMGRLHAAMKETLRLHPPAPLLIPHEVDQDTTLHGYDIPAKTRVLVNVWAIGRDSSSWLNADEFQPERFIHRAFDYSALNDFRFIPFGAGWRGCPGIAFGTRLAGLALANMLYHFNWELPDGQDLQSFQLIESSGFSPGLKCALTLVAKPLQE